MKVKPTLFHSLLAVAALLLLAPQATYAQVGQTFTITNGSVQWLESESGTPYAIGYKYDGAPNYQTSGLTASDVTLDVKTGSLFVQLDTSGNGSLRTTGNFNQFCIWNNTDNPGYCFQEYTVADGSKTYRYYLRGTATDISVWKVEKGQALATATMWYAVDGGGYVDMSYVRNGVKNIDYRWFSFNGSTFQMSCASAHRPEAERYMNEANTIRGWYCNNNSGTGPATTGAVLLPVEVEEVPASVDHPAGVNVALAGIDLTNSVIAHGESTTASPRFTDAFNNGTATFQITESYREVTRYTRLKGVMSTGYSDDYGYNQRGIPSSETAYFYSSENYSTSHTTPPSAHSVGMSSVTVASYQWELDNYAKHYLTISGANTANPTITCIATPAPDDYQATLILTVTSNDGVSESISQTITVSSETGHVDKTESVNSVFIGGAVVGGGRMADIEGASDVLVNSCDTIPYVYGGNDISGTVTQGSTVTIGSTGSIDYIGINSVYGAGNGYYSYNGTSAPFSDCGSRSIAQGTVVRNWGEASGNPIATAAENTNVPLIYKARVIINSSWARIDTVFGGARNAHVLPLDPTVTYTTAEGADLTSADTLASVTVNAGVVYAVFGGNNVGGCMNLDDPLANRTRTSVTINMTNIQGVAADGTGSPSWNNDTTIVNSYYTNFGRHFGIRYVYGGGNKVFSSLRSDVFIYGGMIDTVFGGGNEASVFRSNVTVNCEKNGSNTIYHNNWVTDHNWNTAEGAKWASRWVGTRGSYNVRAVFGGNNRAAMECVPDVLLEAGGIATVYGGGNAGDMTNEELNIGDGDKHYRAAHVTAINNAKAEFKEAKNKIAPPQAALGTFIHVAHDKPNMWIDYIYGGCRAANVAHATLVHIEGGNIGALFGGCNISGNVGQAVVTHEGGRARGGTYVALDDNARVYNNVYGGSNGYYHCVDDEHAAAAVYTSDIQFEDNEGTPFDMFDEHVGLTRPTHNFTHVAINGGEVFGNVYGGGNHATVGFVQSTYGYPSPSGIVTGVPASQKVGGVHLSLVKGIIHGNAFGGSNMATVYGLSYFYIGDKPDPDGGRMTILGSVYGGNDRLGDVGNNVNAAFVAIDGTEIKASDNTALNEGGKAAYNTYILVEGTPQIKRLFGGGNGAYNYTGANPEYPEIQAYCNTSTANATTAPVLASAFVDIHTDKGARIDTLFGGGNAVDVQDRVMVLVNTQQHLFDEDNLDDPDLTDITIGTLFGGNNVASMACVPTIDLNKGVVSKIFGGGNMGHMLGATNTISDLCGNTVPSVASFVHIHSEDATVANTVFGGCNKADVHGMAYVLIENTSSHGVDTVYGGNDVSGRITGDTRVDIYGGNVGTIYGGSNGYYDYEKLAPGDYRVREFDHSSNTGQILFENSIGSPFVDETFVNVFGGTVRNNIYGGGRMGDCRETNVYINDRTADSDSASGCDGASPATIMGWVYGGGEGDTARLDIAHRGNVTEATHLQLHHASNVIAQAYGGGKGGDVYNANISSYNTWDKSFSKIFGGCWGADVTGTARLTIDANMEVLKNDASMFTAVKVHGGNDFSGNCYRSEVFLNSGRFDTVYGAGCGNVPAANYLAATGTYTKTRDLHVPNNEEVVVTVNGEDLNGTKVWVMGELYGGGHMGTTMRYLKNSDGQYVDAGGNVITSAAQEKVADTNTTVATAHTDALDYAYIVLNIHGGEFAKDIFTGAQGLEGLGQLIYGLKVLNMDGGHVKQSIYGGSQSVSDGYSKQECNASSGNKGVIDVSTTMRPSSIINIIGGTIDNHAYGAGFKGFTYGSVYVNVGVDAIEKSTVWRTAYGPSGNRIANAYAAFKPGATRGLSDELTFGNNLKFLASIYAGANWGQSDDDSYTFNTPGFFGGESRIIIDGKGYSTDHTDINIDNSVLGAGTSVLGGDMLSRIDIRNYGGIKGCEATKQLKAVQRADALYLHNTGIDYTGTPDASSALFSPDYAINRIDTVNSVGFNLIEIDAPKANINMIRFFEDVADMTCYDYITYPTSGSCLIPATLSDLTSGSQICGSGLTHCDKIGRIDPTNHKYTAILMNDGVTIDIQEADGDFGSITGYAYLIAEDGTKPIVRARQKSGAGASDGGFSECCNADNGSDGMSYTDYSNIYRFWSPGSIRSTREVVLLAHSKPSLLDEDKPIKVIGTDGSTERKLSIAHTTLTLPPSKEGHYYKFKLESGITISDENDNITLIDVAWNPVSWSSLPNNGWETYATGAWYFPSPAVGSTTSNFLKEDHISTNVNSIFGLVMASGEGFTSTAATTLSTSTHTTLLADYATGQVTEDNISPVLDLYLTYDSTLFNSILGSVKFVLVEYDRNGVETGDFIEVEAYISTIINEFKDMEFDLIATTNDGESNIFLRRGILPATLQTQQLYIQSVKWYPTEPSLLRSQPYEGTLNNKFQISGDRSNGGYILTADEGQVANNKFRFAINVKPIENTSSSNTSDVGWYTINKSEVDVYSLVYNDNVGRRTNVSTTSDQSDYPGYPASAANPLTAADVNFSDLTGGGASRGELIGVLDGRGLAGINFELFYDGRVVNDYAGYFVGDVVLGMASYKNGVPDATAKPFNITLHIQVRPGSDTIYVASASTVSRNGITITYNSDWTDLRDGNVGKSPKNYVRTFEDALGTSTDNMGNLKPNIVICVLDSVEITSDVELNGVSEEEPLKIIRYEGHHHEAGHEAGVYRGPMIIVKDGGKLTMRNVLLQGSAVAMREYASDTSGMTALHLPNQLTSRNSKKHLLADTNVAAGPVIAIRQGGTVHLAQNVTIEENWNGYTGTEKSHHRGSAISVVKGGMLNLSNDVTIQNNIAFDTRTTTGHCDNGAIYVDGGIVSHPESSGNRTAITITNNYLIKNVGNNVPAANYWVPQMDENDNTKLYMWVIDTATVNKWNKANLFLTRKANETKGNGFISNGMPLKNSAELTAASRIGISKWFPGDPTLGEDPRDTIYFAYQDGSNADMPNRIVSNGIFSSDEGYNIRYSHGVNEQNIYLTRCATFRHQIDGAIMDSEVDEHEFEHIIEESVPLEFVADTDATCPTGKDILTYRVSKGMLPYTYTWVDNKSIRPSGDPIVVQSFTTPYSSTEMWDGLYWDYLDAVDEEDPESIALAEEPLKETFENSLQLPYVQLPITNEQQQYDYTVTATDAFGCKVAKRIQINVYKDRTLSDVNDFVEKPVEAHWTDTNSYLVDNTVVAKGDRVYRGVIINAMVWPDRNAGRENYITVSDASWVNSKVSDVTELDLTTTSFCEGDIINLHAKDDAPTDCGSGQYQFSMWDFDPYYATETGTQSNYVVPHQDATVIAYYTPTIYWSDAIVKNDIAIHEYSHDYFTLRPGSSVDAVTTYNDDLHIYTERGLAFFLTQVNGLNGMQTREFYFNKVYLHDKPGGYDMKCYRWTPVGTARHPFRGWFIGTKQDEVSDTYTTTEPSATPVVIKNLIVDEPSMSHVGFFGNLDTARISGIQFESAYIRGAHDAGVLAARSKDSRIDNVSVSSAADADVTTTLIMTHNNSGGLIGYSEDDKVSSTSVAAKFVGDAIYSGGIYGYGDGSTVVNSTARNYNRMSGVYLGGIAGCLDGVAPRPNTLFGRKSSGRTSYVANNYVHLVTPGSSARVGGIAGVVRNAVLENNYVYGQIEGSFVSGGLAAQVEGNTTATNNYYASSAAKQKVGSTTGRTDLHDNTDFAGSGNAVTLSDRVYGVDNLTRVLNIWVRQQNAAGGEFETWTSDLTNRNGGYPFFGDPDLIPVASSASVEGCEEVEWLGQLFTTDTVIVERYIDSTMMVDSTVSTLIRVHHAAYTRYADSAFVGEDYIGHGFYVSAAESELLRRTLDSAGYATIVLSDTLQSAYGCDSIVLLTLTFSGTKGIVDVSTTTEVKVYPNPTTSTVNVAAEGMTRVEVYDNEGRRLQNYTAQGQPVITLNVEHLASGIYYLRVHTPNGVTIQKVIKR